MSNTIPPASPHTALITFALAVLRAWHHDGDRCDVDGGTLQELALSSGVCVALERQAPCGTPCPCHDAMGDAGTVSCIVIRPDVQVFDMPASPPVAHYPSFTILAIPAFNDLEIIVDINKQEQLSMRINRLDLSLSHLSVDSHVAIQVHQHIGRHARTEAERTGLRAAWEDYRRTSACRAAVARAYGKLSP